MAVQPPDPPDPTVAQPKSYASLFTKSVPPPILSNDSSNLEFFKGYPAVTFSKEEIDVLARPYKSALVGKFDGYRPPLPELRRRMDTIGFKGSYKLSLLHSKHVLIQFAQETDYQRCWLKRSWNLGSSIMKIIPWTKNWSSEAESPIAPVWVELVGLPIHFFAKSSLLRITRPLGEMIKLDAATENMTRPSVAKISIAMNLLQTTPDRIWIGTGEDEGFWQTVQCLDKPDFCTKCSRIGHKLSDCGGHKVRISENNPTIANLSVWREVHRPEGLGNSKVSIQNAGQEMAEKSITSTEKLEAQPKELIMNGSSKGGHVSTHVLQKQKEFIMASKEINQMVNNGTKQHQHPFTETLNANLHLLMGPHEGMGVNINPILNSAAAEPHLATQSMVPEIINNEKDAEGSNASMGGQMMEPISNLTEEEQQDACPTGEQLNNELLTLETNDFGSNSRPAGVQILQTDLHEEGTEILNVMHGNSNVCMDKESTMKNHSDPVPVADPVNTATIHRVPVADPVNPATIHRVPVADTVACPVNPDTIQGVNVADIVGVNAAISSEHIQYLEAIDNYINMERAEQMQMEALDLAEPRQKITKGHMELRKLGINATRMEELLKMDSIGTGVSSRLRSKDGRSMMDSIGKTPLEYAEEMNQTEQMEDTDEDTEEFDYMDEMARQWEVNIGSSRRRALQKRRKANKIAARGNTLISNGKCHAYEVKRQGGSKI